jgi:hypothetical protein
MKRYAALTAFLMVGVLACNPIVPPAPAAACTAAPVRPASSVVQDPNDTITIAPAFKAIDPTSIDEVADNRLLTDPTGLKVGDTIASNCNTGIIRKISKITNAGASGARPQDISKVYIETTPASLETAITKGTVDLDFGNINFSEAELTPAMLEPGVSIQRGVGARPQAVTLTINERIFNFGSGGATAQLKVSGNLENNLNPTFNLKFSNGSVERFEVGLAGTFKMTLNGGFSATGTVGKGETLVPLLKKPLEYTRTFAIGAIPVVVVVTLEPVIGYAMNVQGTVSATASISPTLDMKFGTKYVRGANPLWTPTNTPPTFALNPSFTYGAKINGTAEVFAKLLVGIKIYGVAGPNIESKAFMGINFNPASSNPLATLQVGTKAVGTLAFDLNVLGAGVNVNLGQTTLLAPSPKVFNCTDKACAAQ